MLVDRQGFVVPIVTGALATVLGGLLLYWLVGDASDDKRVENHGAPQQARWQKLKDEEQYARNYVRRTKDEHEWVEQVVTVFELPMTKDRMSGKKISANEFLEFFKLPGTHNRVVMQVRRNEGVRWLLSRQTILLDNFPSLAGLNPESDDITFQLYWLQLQREVDRTRHRLSEEF